MILSKTKFDIDDHKNFEGQTTIGNGKINIRGSFEEGLKCAPQNKEYIRYPTNVTVEKNVESISKHGTYCPSITGNHPLLNNVIVNLPYLLGVTITCENESFDMHDSKYRDLLIELDTETGEYQRSLIWQTNAGGEIKLKFQRFASFTKEQIIGQKITINRLSGQGLIHVLHRIDSNVTTSGYNHFKNIEHNVLDNQLVCCGETDANDKFVMKSKLMLNTQVNEISESNDKKTICHTFTNDYCVDRISNIGKENFELPNDKYDVVFNKHLEKYKKEYNFSRIEIEGNAKLQNICDFSVYHLLRAQDFNSAEYAICAKGFAGEAYFGHYFWDTEIFMLPFFVYSHPERAKKLLTFRYNALQSAIANAKKYGYRGAKYPWESSLDGSEQCPNWQYADFEIHVSADIIYGITQYYENTKDIEFLRDKGIKIIIEVANYFENRIYKNGENYELNGVMGPDEYMFFTDNNYFTNYMVNEVFKSYKKYMDLLGNECDSRITNLIDRLPLIRNGNILMQCENFERYEKIDVDKTWPNREGYFASNISQEQNYRSRFLKQADVVNLFHLFDTKFTEDEMKESLEYYEPITSHDSSLSKIIHTIVKCKLNKSSIEDIVDAGGLDLYDSGSAEGIHIANAGGVWQSIFFGLLGAKNTPGSLEFNDVQLPHKILKIKMNVIVQGKIYQITKTIDRLEVVNISDN